MEVYVDTGIIHIDITHPSVNDPPIIPDTNSDYERGYTNNGMFTNYRC